MHLSRFAAAMLIVVCGAALGSIGAMATNLDEASGGKDAVTCNRQ
jgi:hypothetical protein